MLSIDILTLFPNMFDGMFSESILKRAQEKNLLSFHLINFRDFAFDKHKQVDDTPFGGGDGMLLKPEPIFRAVDHAQKNFAGTGEQRVIILSPTGKIFTQQKAKELSKASHLIFICGHYEGFDARIFSLAKEEDILSIGDYVLTGGELPAMVIIDAVARMIPDVLGSKNSAQTDSFFYEDDLLEAPQYTKPRIFNNMEVPEILFSGHHEKIALWRKEQAELLTQKQRPDLFKKYLEKKQKNF